MHATQARLTFESLFVVENPSREEMFMRPDFRLLAASVGMSMGECWDALVKLARDKHENNIEAAAKYWYGQVTAPRL